VVQQEGTGIEEQTPPTCCGGASWARSRAGLLWRNRARDQSSGSAAGSDSVLVTMEDGPDHVQSWMSEGAPLLALDYDWYWDGYQSWVKTRPEMVIGAGPQSMGTKTTNMD